jgi:hypothetical protein
MQCILYKIYFWEVFHMYYNLICILYALLCGQKFYSCKKWVLYHRSLRLLSELERRLDLTLNSQQGFAYATTIKPEPLQMENYK